MKTNIKKIEADWIDIKNACRVTVNKEDSTMEATETFKRKLLKSEHSPIRLLKVNWVWEKIKSWVSVHYSRHKWECFISTQRSDRTGANRDEIEQGALVNLKGEANAQHLIDMARKRLCFQSSKETRQYMEDMKVVLKDINETKELSDFLTPNCIYRCGCPEFEECGYWSKFVENNRCGQLLDIDKRYEIYNKEFHNRVKERTKYEEL